MAQNSTLDNYTIVYTDNQTKGRGQHESKWISEPYKNLTFSLFTRFKDLKITHQKYLNFAVSLAIFDTLNDEKLTNIFIKWPNDIMSANKKICGILIENTYSGSNIKNCIIGIGLNVNQIDFSSLINKVTSLRIETNKEFDLEYLLKNIASKIEEKITLLNNKDYNLLEENYLKQLYKKNIPTMFKNSKNVLFMGIIKGVSLEGKLQILLEDDTIKEFGIKEISFA